MTLDQSARQEAGEYLHGLNLGTGEPHPSCFIVGAPRSGTTLLTQALAYCTDIGYVDNLIARFFWLPELGVKIRRELGYERSWSGHSAFGATRGISEPHEFGLFWRRWLGYSDMFQDDRDHDLAPLAAKLRKISAQFGGPVLYKPFLLIWHMAQFHAGHAPDSRWVHVVRDTVQNGRSLLDFRVARGDIAAWQSLVPLSARQYTSPHEQVVAQVVHINRWIDDQFTRMPAANVCRVDYDDLRGNFTAEVQRIGAFLGTRVTTERLGEAARDVTTSSRERETAGDDAVRVKLEKALDHVL